MIIISRNLRIPDEDIIELIYSNISNDIIVPDLSKLSYLNELDEMLLKIKRDNSLKKYIVLFDLHTIPSYPNNMVRHSTTTRILQKYDNIIVVSGTFTNPTNSTHKIIGSTSYLYAAFFVMHLDENGYISVQKDRDNFTEKYSIIPNTNYKVYLRENIIDNLLEED